MGPQAGPHRDLGNEAHSNNVERLSLISENPPIIRSDQSNQPAPVSVRVTAPLNHFRRLAHRYFQGSKAYGMDRMDRNFNASMDLHFRASVGRLAAARPNLSFHTRF